MLRRHHSDQRVPFGWGNALHFDGFNDAVTSLLPDFKFLNVASPTFSIMLTVYPTSSSGNKVIWSYANASTARSMSVLQTGLRVYFQTLGTSSTADFSRLEFDGLTLNAWNQLIWVCDGSLSTGDWTIYHNGIGYTVADPECTSLANTATAPIAIQPTFANSFSNNGATGLGEYEGYMDSAFFQEHAISAAEASSRWNGGVGDYIGDNTGVIAHYTFDENTGALLSDVSGPNNGDLVGYTAGELSNPNTIWLPHQSTMP